MKIASILVVVEKGTFFHDIIPTFHSVGFSSPTNPLNKPGAPFFLMEKNPKQPPDVYKTL